MEFCNEHIKAKSDKNLEFYFHVKKRIKIFFNIYKVHPYKENKICLPS